MNGSLVSETRNIIQIPGLPDFAAKEFSALLDVDLHFSHLARLLAKLRYSFHSARGSYPPSDSNDSIRITVILAMAKIF